MPWEDHFRRWIMDMKRKIGKDSVNNIHVHCIEEAVTGKPFGHLGILLDRETTLNEFLVIIADKV